MFFGDPEALAGAAVMMLVNLFGGGGALPLGVPPAEEDPMMTRVAPAECLFYYSWQGRGEADAKSGNSTEALMADPQIRKLLIEVNRRIEKAVAELAEAEGADSPQAILAPHGLELGHTLLEHPAAIFVSEVRMEGGGPPDVRGGALIHLGKNADKLKADWLKLQAQFLGEAATPDEIDGHKVTRINMGPDAPEIVWGVIREYALIGIGENGFENILANIKTEAPQWLKDVRGEIGVPRLSTMAYVDVASIKELALPLAGPDGEEFQKILAAFGGDNVTSLSMISGLDADGFVLRSLAAIDGESRGVLKLADAQPLMHEDLEVIPADSNVALAARVDLSKILAVIREIAAEIDPRALEEFNEGLAEFEFETDVDVAELSAALGDVWCAYNSPGEGGLFGTGLTVTVNLRDHGRAEAQLTKLLERAKEEFGGGDRWTPALKEFEFNGETIYFMSGGFMPVAPSFCLTKEYFIFGLFPQNIKAMLSRGDEFRSLAEVKQVTPLLKMDGGPSVLLYQDTQELFKLAYPFAQMMLAAMQGEASEEGFNIDLSLLPPASSIIPHLKPDTGMMARTRAGLVFESRTSFPGGIVGAASPIVLGMTVPFMAMEGGEPPAAIAPEFERFEEPEDVEGFGEDAAEPLDEEELKELFEEVQRIDPDSIPRLELPPDVKLEDLELEAVP